MAQPTNEPIVTAQSENGIKTIAFNIPTKKNPIKPESMDIMLGHIKESEQDGTKVIVLTGEGGNFSSGALLAPEMLGEFDVTAYLNEKANPLILAIRNSNVPVIAKVKGVCVGLGFSIALACDMLLACDNTIFSQIFTRIGLSADGGGSYFLTELLGHRKAFELIATNRNIEATEAMQMGIANQVYLSSEFDEGVSNLVNFLANGPGIALTQVKKNVREATTGTLASTLAEEAKNQAACFKSADFKEGIKAFMEKRPANFKGE
jgi:2-(1,2-epoxy-1,2-dihydrophenyl)acetyl-CoA isomerase